MSDENELRQKLAAKEEEFNEVYSTFQEIKTAYETLNLQMQKKDVEIQGLKSQLEMKETQISTVSGIVKTKDEFIESMKQTLKMKEEQLLSLTEVKDKLEVKAKEAENSVDSSLLEEKEETIKRLEEEIKLLNLDLKAADDEVEVLHKKIEETSSEINSNSGTSTGIITSDVNREKILDFIIQMLGRALHNVNLTTPNIMDLAELSLYDVKANVNIKASCNVDIGNSEHQELLQEFQALDNINLRNFDEQDRWICLKDNEEMFIAAVGENNNNLAFFSSDSKHIKLFNALIMESWLRARKI